MRLPWQDGTLGLTDRDLRNPTAHLASWTAGPGKPEVARGSPSTQQCRARRPATVWLRTGRGGISADVYFQGFYFSIFPRSKNRPRESELLLLCGHRATASWAGEGDAGVLSQASSYREAVRFGRGLGSGSAPEETDAPTCLRVGAWGQRPHPHHVSGKPPPSPVFWKPRCCVADAPSGITAAEGAGNHPLPEPNQGLAPGPASSCF